MNSHIASGSKSTGTTKRRARQRQQRRSPYLSLVVLLLCFHLAPCIAFVQQFRPHLVSYDAAWSSVTFGPRTTSPTVLSMAVAKSGGKIILDEAQFAKNVLDPDSIRPVMVFFTAPWCGPCRLSAPVVKDVMTEYSSQFLVVEVCTDDLPEVAAVAGVVSIPTIQMYFQGQLLDTIVGCVARNVLASSVAKVLEDTTLQDDVDVYGDDTAL